jgi:hypothetical protein
MEIEGMPYQSRTACREEGVEDSCAPDAFDADFRSLCHGGIFRGVPFPEQVTVRT